LYAVPATFCTCDGLVCLRRPGVPARPPDLPRPAVPVRWVHHTPSFVPRRRAIMSKGQRRTIY